VSTSELEAWEGKVRYAVVGLGHIAQVAVLPAFAHAKHNSQLTALVSDDYEKLEQLGGRYGVSATYSYEQYEACLRSGNVDAVYIALPNHMHCEYAVRAAEAGVHVLCEKPMAVSEQECADMIAAAEQNHTKLMVAYRLHFERANLSTVELARSGKLGELRIFDSVFCMDIRDENNIRLSPLHMGGGTVYDLGIYCINAARYLFGDEPTEVVAVSVNNGEPRFQNGDEMTHAILRFPGDRIATFTSSFGATDVSEYRLVGTRGEVRLDPAYEYAERLRQFVTIEGHTELHELERRDQFAPELAYFSSCIQHDREPEPSGWEGLADVRVVQAVYESARIGRAVQLPPFTRKRRPTMDQEIALPPVEQPTEIRARGPSG
jgi:glucose-fructose oxidoreductase